MRISMMPGMIAGLAMMIAALWGWNHATRLAEEATRPEVIFWAVRSGAIALAAGAQLVLLTWVVGKLYRRDLLCDGLRLSAALVCSIAIVSAVALGLAGR